MKISKELNAVEDVQKSIDFTNQLLKDNAQLRGFLQSKRFSKDQKRELIHSVFKEEVHPIVQELINMYAGDNPIMFFRNFSFYFNSLVKNELKIATVIAHTADELSNEEKDNLQLQIEKIIGKNTELTTVIDSSLIGGLKLRIDNIFLDASIKTKMENLRKDLLQ
ncbi:MAG: ATP synthase F1 subunit delta [Candidatus Marinimicrobia bacterium]|nr:ATP synthase F1 subunit delta [Candidatus Neomarinimicrobiota bacterium]